MVDADTQEGEDGTIKHFFANGKERDCDYIQDRYGNKTLLSYGQPATMPDGTTHNLLTQVTDPSGRSLGFVWNNFGNSSYPAWRIVEVDGPQYRVTYDYYTDANSPNAINELYNLKAVHLDPDGLDRVTTYTYTGIMGSQGSENGLLASISDPLVHTVSYSYTLGTYDQNQNLTPTPTGTVWVGGLSEPSSGSPLTWTITVSSSPGAINTFCQSSGGTAYDCATDDHLRYSCTVLGLSDVSEFVSYDSANNVIEDQDIQAGEYTGTADQYPADQGELFNGVNVDPSKIDRYIYDPHGNVITHTVDHFPGQETTSYYDYTKYWQKASETDMNGHTATYDYYDRFDNNPGNRGQVKWVKDARYGSIGKEFDYTYNQYGRKASETNLNSVVTQYTYGDQWGNLTQVQQDPAGLNRTTSMTYDAGGHVLNSTDPMSRQSSFVYNSLGQPLAANYPSTASTPAETISYTYGTNGRPESVTDNRGTTSIAYEPGNDRVSSVTDPVTGAIRLYVWAGGGEKDDDAARRRDVDL